MRALSLVRAACTELNMAVFEWSIADGLGRSASHSEPGHRNGQFQRTNRLHPESPRALQHLRSDPGACQHGSDDPRSCLRAEGFPSSHGRSGRGPAPARRGPNIFRKPADADHYVSVHQMPAELEGLVEYLDLPLPDRQRLREIVEETYKRLAKTYTLKQQTGWSWRRRGGCKSPRPDRRGG